MARTVKVAITGAAGQIGYAILPRLASGEVFGHDVDELLITRSKKGIDNASNEHGTWLLKGTLG